MESADTDWGARRWARLSGSRANLASEEEHALRQLIARSVRRPPDCVLLELRGVDWQYWVR